MPTGLDNDPFGIAQRATPFVPVPRWPGPPGVASGKVQALAQNSQKRHGSKPQLKGPKHDVFQAPLANAQSHVLLQVAVGILLAEPRGVKLDHFLWLQAKVAGEKIPGLVVAFYLECKSVQAGIRPGRMPLAKYLLVAYMARVQILTLS